MIAIALFFYCGVGIAGKIYERKTRRDEMEGCGARPIYVLLRW